MRFEGRDAPFVVVEALVDLIEAPHHAVFQIAEALVHLASQTADLGFQQSGELHGKLRPHVVEAFGHRLREASEAFQNRLVSHASI
ncbi:MAG TPA: hypothetical protein VGC72_02585 [Candidatus Elarobacter sp.]